jgi:glycosyltransferase involved in cell wall biosynthesis
LKIALCIESLSPELTGIGRYCWELARQLPHSRKVDRVLFHRGGRGIKDPAKYLANTPKWHLPRALRGIARARFRHKARACLFHGPNFFLPEWVESGIITIHDLSVLRFSETHPVERIRQFEKRFESSLLRAAHVITDSHFIRDEVIGILGLSPERVSAVPLGINPTFSPHTMQIEQNLSTLGLPVGGYGLCVATFEPRKKVTAAIEAWSQLSASLRSRFPLVLAGARGWLNDEMEALIHKGQNEGWLIRLGYVPESELRSLYAAARLFVYPSIYEGFGLPPIEAMACGVPVIVSDRSCLPEITDGAARLIDPDDIEKFSEVIAECLLDEQWRIQAIEAGIKVASRYKWENCFDKTIEIYENIFTIS